MGKKKKEETPAIEASAELEGQIIPYVPCSAWCFLFGAGFQYSCVEEKGHKGDHRISITIGTEPKSSFTIYWFLGEPEPLDPGDNIQPV